MDAYQTLRQRAIQKRDDTIQEAREVYRRDMAAIEAIARSLYDGGPPPVVEPETTLAKILRLIPRNRPFTIPELMAGLEQSNPGQSFGEQTVRTYVSRMASQGDVRKLYKSKDGYMLWVAADAEITGGDFSAMLIADAAQCVLVEDGPMKLPELVLALQARGYRADSAPRTIMRSVRGAFKRSPGRFGQQVDGRWGALSQ